MINSQCRYEISQVMGAANVSNIQCLYVYYTFLLYSFNMLSIIYTPYVLSLYMCRSLSATLRVEALHRLNTLHAEMATARNLQYEIDGLELKIADTQALLEKREMEAKEALHIQVRIKYLGVHY